MVKSQNKAWVMVSVLAIGLLVAGAICFYFYYYFRPNFGNKEFNFISQSSSSVVNPGDSITYTINYKNSGNTAVNNLVILASIPENAALSSIIDRSNSTELVKNKVIEFKIGNLNKNEGGKVSYTVKINDPLNNGTKIKNGSIIFKYEANGKKLTHSLADYVESTIKSSPDFKEFNIKMLDENGGNLNTGDRVIFTISLKNSGNMNASGVKIVDVIPSKLDIIEKSISSGGKYDPFSKKILWNLDNLNKDTYIKLQFEAIIGSDFYDRESFKNVVQLIYNQGAELNIKNESFVEGVVHALPDLSSSMVTASAANNKDIWAWELLKYTVYVKNTGKGDALNVKLNCPIPLGTGYVGDSASDKAAILDPAKSLLQFNINEIKAGEEKIFTFRVVVAGYLTGGGEIEAKFYLEEDGQKVEIPPVISKVKPYIFQTIVCMGDSLVVLEDWAKIFDDLLEKTYIHAEFNTIATGVKGEKAVDAIKRFDSDVRIHNPQIIILGYGSNDSGGGTGFFRYHLDILVKQAKSTGAKVFVYGTGYIDTSGRWKGKADYKAYNDIIKNDICPSNGAVYIDIYTPMSVDPKKYVKKDGMHWTEAGSELVANTIFRTVINYLDDDGRLK